MFNQNSAPGNLSALSSKLHRAWQLRAAKCSRSVGFSYPKSDFESSKMEAHEVAPDVVDVLPAKAMEVRASYI